MRWKKATEIRPENNVRVLICNENGYITIARYDSRKDCFVDIIGMMYDNDEVMWQPVPELPEEWRK